MEHVITPPGRNPVIELLRKSDGRSSGARAFALLDCTLPRLQEAFDRIEITGDFHSFVKHIPMVKELKKKGDRYAIELQFKVAILSVKFGAEMRLVREGPNAIRFDYIEGEPDGLSLRFAGHPMGDKVLLQIDVGYEIDSLGWLAKHFLRHHPEIRDGAHAGTAVAIVEALRTAVERMN